MKELKQESFLSAAGFKSVDVLFRQWGHRIVGPECRHLDWRLFGLLWVLHNQRIRRLARICSGTGLWLFVKTKSDFNWIFFVLKIPAVKDATIIPTDNILNQVLLYWSHPFTNLTSFFLLQFCQMMRVIDLPDGHILLYGSATLCQKSMVDLVCHIKGIRTLTLTYCDISGDRCGPI